jgi:hypothetical protein
MRLTDLRRRPPDWFTGTVRIDPLFQALDPARVADVSSNLVARQRPSRGRLRYSG